MSFGIGVSFKPLHTTIPVTRTWLRITFVNRIVITIVFIL